MSFRVWAAGALNGRLASVARLLWSPSLTSHDPNPPLPLDAGASAVATPLGVEAVAAVGIVVAMGAALIAGTGVSAVGTIGTSTATGDANAILTGMSASATLGTVRATGTRPPQPAIVVGGGMPFAYQLRRVDATVLVVGVRAIAAVGTAGVAGGAQAAPVGVEAIAALTQPVASSGAGIALTGVFASATLNTVRASAAASVTGDGSSVVAAVGVASAHPDAVDLAWFALQRDMDEEEALVLLGVFEP